MTEGGVCVGCVTGALHEGIPKGTVSTIAKLPTYIANPVTTPHKSGVIVIIPDAFGWEFINIRLLADEYAERSGRTIYVPDFMSGTAPLLALVI
jgi:dienelactone hydrolase